MARIFLSVLAFGLLIVLTGSVLGAIAPWLLLPVAVLLGLLLVAIGVCQTAGQRPRNYRQIETSDMSIGMLGGSWRYPFFYEQKIPTPTPRRKTVARARRVKTRSGA